MGEEAGARSVQAKADAAESALEHLEEEVEEKIHILAYAGYYFILFMLHWGGTARFNKAKHPDDDFDPESVKHFLKHKQDGSKFYAQNFQRVDHKKLRRIQAVKKTKLEAKAQAQAGQDAPLVAPVASAAPAPPKPEEGGMLDGIATKVEQGEAEEDEVYENLFIKQIPPYFILFECLFVLVLWIVGAALYKGPGSDAGIVARKGGLDTLDPSLYGDTDLRWSDAECHDLRWQAWRWWSYQFTHVGITHVGMNVLLNILMGIPLEGAHGWWRTGLMYNAGVFGGAMCFYLLDGHTAVVGCSGGCYALIGIHFADLLMNWDSKKFKYPTLFMLVFLVAVDVINVVVTQPKGTSHSAHLGGAVFGLVVGVLLCKNLVEECYERVIEVQMGVIALGLIVFAFVWLGIQDEGPKNIFQTVPGWCSAFAYRDIPAGDSHPRILCSYCGVVECVEALRYQYKDCCPIASAADCTSEPYYCVQPIPVTADYCKQHSALWVDLSALK